MAAKADFPRLEMELLGALQAGPLAAASVRAKLGVSPATLSRLVQRLGSRLVVAGKGRATRYLARRQVNNLAAAVPVFEILEDGRTRELGTLTPVMPKGFRFAATAPGVASREYPDLPYFLNDQRPAGFLGRAVPRRHPDLELPSDIRTWSGETCLRYLSRHGWNHGGSLIVGEASFNQYRRTATQPPATGDFVALAAEAMDGGLPGSSAGGEQPKFLTWGTPDGPHLIVKFSYPTPTAANQRMADLLVCEHLALEHIRQAGLSAARTEIVNHGSQTFLAVERFDRVGRLGRRGLFSLLSLHAEFSGAQGGWAEAARDLARRRLIPADAAVTAAWLEDFGHLIANTDMHFGNLSFLAAGTAVTGLAPAYDMSPMLYAPTNGEVISRSFAAPLPPARATQSWATAWEAARRFWRAAARDERISGEFRAICAENAGKLDELAELARLLPES